MKMKVAKILILLSCTIQLAAQPCTPLANFPGNQGILPSTLPPAYLDAPYSTVMQLKAPADTNVVFNGFPVKFVIDSMRLVQTIGLPPGITFQCNPVTCMLLGGQTGCALISGQATAGGVYPIKLIIRTVGKVQLIFPIPQASVDTNEQYTIYVFQNTGIAKVIDTQVPFSVYPNPASQSVSVNMHGLPGEKLNVYDASGKLVYTFTNEMLQETLTIGLSEFVTGVYVAERVNSVGVKRSRFIVR